MKLFLSELQKMKETQAKRLDQDERRKEAIEQERKRKEAEIIRKKEIEIEEVRKLREEKAKKVSRFWRNVIFRKKKRRTNIFIFYSLFFSFCRPT